MNKHAFQREHGGCYWNGKRLVYAEGQVNTGMELFSVTTGAILILCALAILFLL